MSANLWRDHSFYSNGHAIPTAMTLIAVIEACRIPLSMDLYRHLAARTNVTVSRVMERVARIELAPTAWKAEVLPLNYTREFSNPLIHRVFRASLRLSSPAFTDAYCFPARLTAESYHLVARVFAILLCLLG